MLRSLLPLALACAAWTMPALAAGPQQRFPVTPQRQALLNTIRYAEGTWKQGEDGYRVLFGGSLFRDFRRHPDKVVHRWPYSSAAAGAYQFLPATWRMAKKALQLRDFSPRSQDQAALYLVQRRKALRLADRGVFTRELAAKLAPEWASFPTLANRSYYGQPVRSFRNLKPFYDVQLAKLRQTMPHRLVAGPPPALPAQSTLAARSRRSGPHPTPARWIPVANSEECNGELLCLLDHVAHGRAPIQPGSLVSRS